MSKRISAAVKPYMLPEADRNVASRFSHGVDDQLVRDVRAAGSGLAWFEKQLNHKAIDDSAADAVKSWFPLVKDDANTALAKTRSGKATVWGYGLSYVEYWTAHALLTRRHVHGQMVSFWGNLFYIPAHQTRTFQWRFSFDQTIRANALSSFRQLLRACVTHPAMAAWLDNDDNTAQGINENLGRELLELYTVGRTGGYTEAHVKDSARLLTGFRTKQGDSARSWYDTTKHWTGPVQILDFQHANTSPDGRAAVDAYLDHLALHPATAARIAYRLCQRFVADVPPQQIVDAVAAAYLASGSDIKATLRALVRHPQFATSRRAKLRTPLEDVIASNRVLGRRPVRPTKATTSLVRHCVWMSTGGGYAPFRWPRPDGYPEHTDAYANPARMIRAWNHHQDLAGNWWNSTGLRRTPPSQYLPTAWPRRLDEIVEHQTRLLLGRTTSPAALRAICAITGRSRGFRYANAKAIHPSHLNIIRTIILNLPEGITR